MGAAVLWAILLAVGGSPARAGWWEDATAALAGTTDTVSSWFSRAGEVFREATGLLALTPDAEVLALDGVNGRAPAVLLRYGVNKMIFTKRLEIDREGGSEALPAGAPQGDWRVVDASGYRFLVGAGGKAQHVYLDGSRISFTTLFQRELAAHMAERGQSIDPAVTGKLDGTSAVAAAPPAPAWTPDPPVRVVVFLRSGRATRPTDLAPERLPDPKLLHEGRDDPGALFRFERQENRILRTTSYRARLNRERVRTLLASGRARAAYVVQDETSREHQLSVDGGGLRLPVRKLQDVDGIRLYGPRCQDAAACAASYQVLCVGLEDLPPELRSLVDRPVASVGEPEAPVQLAEGGVFGLNG